MNSDQCLHGALSGREHAPGPWRCPDCGATIVIGMNGHAVSVIPSDEEEQARIEAARAATPPAPPPLPAPRFACGDVVTLNSGGARMTVQGTDTSGQVDLAWFDGSKLEGVCLDQEMLMLAEES